MERNRSQDHEGQLVLSTYTYVTTRTCRNRGLDLVVSLRNHDPSIKPVELLEKCLLLAVV